MNVFIKHCVLRFNIVKTIKRPPMICKEICGHLIAINALTFISKQNVTKQFNLNAYLLQQILNFNDHL